MGQFLAHFRRSSVATDHAVRTRTFWSRPSNGASAPMSTFRETNLSRVPRSLPIRLMLALTPRILLIAATTSGSSSGVVLALGGTSPGAGLLSFGLTGAFGGSAATSTNAMTMKNALDAILIFFPFRQALADRPLRKSNHHCSPPTVFGSDSFGVRDSFETVLETVLGSGRQLSAAHSFSIKFIQASTKPREIIGDSRHSKSPLLFHLGHPGSHFLSSLSLQKNAPTGASPKIGCDFYHLRRQVPAAKRVKAP